MSAPAHSTKLPARLALLAAAAALMCAGCMLSAPTESSPASGPSDALRGTGPEGNSEVPHCSKVWSSADADSVLYCPDVRPSGPPH